MKYNWLRLGSVRKKKKDQAPKPEWQEVFFVILRDPYTGYEYKIEGGSVYRRPL